MTRTSVAIAFFGTACAAKPAPPPVAQPQREPGLGSLGFTEEVAMRYEHGDGLPRDYTQAIRIHETLCAGGTGDPLACRRLAYDVALHRGEPENPRVDVYHLIVLACEAGDWLSCGGYVPFDEAEAEAACAGDEPAACLAINSLHGWSQSSTVEYEDQARRERACHGGVLDACMTIVTYAGYNDEAPPDEAADAVTDACDHGDADACEVLGTPIDPAELCRANDFAACAVAGVSDPAMLTTACDHGVVDACELVALRARDADPPDPLVAQHFQRACELGSQTACRQNKPDDLVIGCGAYQPHRITEDKRKALPRLTGTVRDVAWTAPVDQPFLVVGFDRRGGGPTVYAELARLLDGELAVYVFPDEAATPDELAPAIALVLDPALEREQVTADNRLGYGWPTIVDDAGRPRAVLSTEWGIDAKTLARCARGLLAEP